MKLSVTGILKISLMESSHGVVAPVAYGNSKAQARLRIRAVSPVRTHKRVNGKCHYLVRRLDYTHFGLCNISKFIHNYFHELRQFSKNIFISTGK